MCEEMKYQEIDFSKVIAVSNRHLTRLPYLEQADRICSFHPRAFLLREKDLPLEDYLRLAEEVKRICDRHHVTLISHFYPEAAARIGTRFLHLPLWKMRELQQGACEETGGKLDREYSIETAGEARIFCRSRSASLFILRRKHGKRSGWGPRISPQVMCLPRTARRESRPGDWNF